MANWITDPHADTLKMGAKTRPVADVYAQWLLHWGQQHRQSKRNSGSSVTDFNYVVRSKKLTKAGRPKQAQNSGGAANGSVDPMVSLLPVRDISVAQGNVSKPPHNPSDAGLDPDKLVIIGVIDDGVNVFNQRFRPSGHASRIDYAWAQDGPAPQSGATVPFGAEMTSAQISAAMDAVGDERAKLAEHGFAPDYDSQYMPSVFAKPNTHGTQITDLAAGADLGDLAARNKRLITVQLPAYGVMDTSGASLIAALHHAAIYVFERARMMSAHYLKPLPVVLNVSFGLTAGPRNGQHFLERAFRALALKYREDMRKTFGNAGVPPVVRVVSAGNENILRLHASSLGDVLTMPLRLQPEDQTATFLEIWLPQSSEDAALSLNIPGQAPKVFDFPNLDMAQGAGFAPKILQSNGVLARLTLDTPHLAGANSDDLYWRILLCIAPTSGPNARAPAGLWQVQLTGTGLNGQAKAWILRDEPVSGFQSLGRQAYFDDDAQGTDADPIFDALGDFAVDDAAPRVSTVSRNGAMSGLATNGMLRRKNGGQKPGDGPELDSVSVAAGRWDLSQAALYSAADQLNGDQAPMVMAIAETSRVMPNIRASGTLSGTSSALNGTSAAAPLVTRVFADALSNLAQVDYAGFSQSAFLQTQGVAPPRPVGPETATGLGIRKERLRDGAVMMPAPAELAQNIARDNAAKA